MSVWSIIKDELAFARINRAIKRTPRDVLTRECAAKGHQPAYGPDWPVWKCRCTLRIERDRARA